MRVIGLGQAAAGDDGVGLAVLRLLRKRALPSEVELLGVAEPSALVSLLAVDTPVILVDAVLGSAVGEIVEFGIEDLSECALLQVSSHGLGVFEAIELARVLHDGQVAAIRIVAVVITRPESYQEHLSPEVSAAVPRAAERVLSLIKGAWPAAPSRVLTGSPLKPAR
jgi:hydrogenase maturation protease